MSDPAMMAQVQQMMQNPAILGAMSPQAPQMMQNIQQMMQNPQAMQQMMQFAGTMGGGGMGGQNANPFAAQMAQQMGAALPPPPAGGAETEQPAPGPMDRMRFAMQLQQLAAMGFADEEVCLAALARAQGNVDRALDILFAQ